MSSLSNVIESAWENRGDLNPSNVDSETTEAIEHCIDGLDSGELRVAEPQDGDWIVNEWLKKAVLLYFRVTNNEPISGGYTQFFDKVPLKYQSFDSDKLASSGTRILSLIHI